MPYMQKDGTTLLVPESPAAVASMVAIGWETQNRASPSPLPTTEQQDVEPAADDSDVEPVEAVSAPVVVPVGAPAGNASRGDWAAYAESLGVEPGDMTRNEIKAAVAAL